MINDLWIVLTMLAGSFSIRKIFTTSIVYNVFFITEQKK